MTWHCDDGFWEEAEQYHRGWSKGSRTTWYPPADAARNRDDLRGNLAALIGVALPVQVLEIHSGDETPWPRSWLFSVHSRCLQYHPDYSHTKGARKYYDFNDEELLCSLCVKLEIDFEAAREMGPYELIGEVYERFRELRVPAQTNGSWFRGCGED